MLFAIFVLMLFGVAMVATSSPSVAQTINVDDYYFLKKHILFLLPAVFLVISLSMLSPRYIWRFSSLLLLGGAVMVVMVLFFGAEVKGARRWIGLFGFSIQPSEFLKPAFAVVVAWLLALQHKSNTHSKQADKSFQGLKLSFILYGVLIFLMLMQPDLGMSVVITCVFAVQIFLAGLRFRYLAALFAFGAGGLGCAYMVFHHVRSRIDRFFYPESGDNYQVERSLAAIKKGGFIGTGPGQGIEKATLPDAHSDFTFSVLVEEMGFFFAAILIGIFVFILLRGFKRLQETQDVFSMLAAGGLLSMFALQSLIHIGSSINLLPAKGMTLPFISYGGSSLLSIAISMGMVLALTRQKSRGSIAKSSVPIPYKGRVS